MTSVLLVFRRLVCAILFPGFFAGYVPWRYFGLDRVRLDVFNPAHALGLFCIGVGTALLATVYEPRQFHVSRLALALLVAYVLYLIDRFHATIPT